MKAHEEERESVVLVWGVEARRRGKASPRAGLGRIAILGVLSWRPLV